MYLLLTPKLVRQCALDAGGRLGKYTTRELASAKPAIRTYHCGAKGSRNFSQRGLVRLDDVMREDIGVYGRNLASEKQIGGRRFAHADPSGQTKKCHEQRD